MLDAADDAGARKTVSCGEKCQFWWQKLIQVNVTFITPDTPVKHNSPIIKHVSPEIVKILNDWKQLQIIIFFLDKPGKSAIFSCIWLPQAKVVFHFLVIINLMKFFLLDFAYLMLDYKRSILLIRYNPLTFE